MRVAGVCGTPQPREYARPLVRRPGLRSTADPCHPKNFWFPADSGLNSWHLATSATKPQIKILPAKQTRIIHRLIYDTYQE